MAARLLHVLKAEPATIAAADDALRAMRRACPRADDGRTILLFCDLPPSDTAQAPQDDTLIRRLQSGVMAADARRRGAFMLLVRRRAWSDAARMYTGRDQSTSAEQVVCELLTDGETKTVFAAATCSPGSLKGRYHAILFSDAALSCPPDTPMQMLAALRTAALPCIAGRIIVQAEYPQTVLARLERAGFFLSALRTAYEDRLARRGLASADAPRLFAVDQLPAALAAQLPCPVAQDCIFVRPPASAPTALFAALRRSVLSGRARFTPFPALEAALLYICALLGLPRLALAALLLPELWAVLHPSLLPGALVRLALLPLTAAVTLDAWLCRLFARSACIRIRLPGFFFTRAACAFSGAALIAAAFSGVGALYVLLAVGLLWLGAPLILPALSMPTIERVPVGADEQSQLNALAGDAFYEAMINAPPDASFSRQMLVACAGAMLRLLEPDEAARRTQTLLSRQLADQAAVTDAVDQAAMLVCAQYLREHMAQCDAVLRPLPAELERFVLGQPAPGGDDALSALMRAAHQESSAIADRLAPDPQPLCALFLPLRSARETAMHSITLPLTHPHTFLRRQLSEPPQEAADPIGSFLPLCAAALRHPFYALLRRSAVTAAYIPLLSI